MRALYGPYHIDHAVSPVGTDQEEIHTDAGKQTELLLLHTNEVSGTLCYQHMMWHMLVAHDMAHDVSGTKSTLTTPSYILSLAPAPSRASTPGRFFFHSY
jgi:hypothetical protein